MNKIISRIAPTPSGFLHAGNALNFILTYLYTRAKNGFLWLRIDDYDKTRYQAKFVQNIFDVLEFLQLDYDDGARNLAEFEERFSFKFRLESYRKAILNLDGEIYACECSRTTANAYKNSIYTQICADKKLKFEKDKTVIRIRVNQNLGRNVAQKMGDFVIWKKDDTPSYNLASVVDDEQMGVNLIVRGEDLRDCTNAQIYLAKRLNFKFKDAKFIHHGLMMQDGAKLSKSQNAPAINPNLGAKFYYEIAARSLNLDPKSADSIKNLLYDFQLKFS